MSQRTRTAGRPQPTEVSLEEVLQRAHARFALLADLFELHAVAPGYAQTEALSSAACEALAALCKDGRHDLQAILEGLPGATLNWTTKARVTRSRPARRSVRRA